jgi:transcriptional regulator
MYIPAAFKVSDRIEIDSFIQENSFGQLISNVEGKFFCSHIPFLINEEKDSIICHLAKSNPQWKDIENQEVLVIFQGPHDYISPSWYRNPGVPTWNYQAVHIYGKCELITENEKLSQIVNQLTEKHESSQTEAWKPEYKESMLNAIIGIEVSINDIQCKYKLSQNRSEKDQKQVVKALEDRGSRLLSKAMKNSFK